VDRSSALGVKRSKLLSSFLGLDCQCELSKTLVGPSGTEQGTGGHCLERRCPGEQSTCSSNLRTVTLPKTARPISLRVQGATSGLESTRRRASSGEGHNEHPEIQEGDSDQGVNPSTSQDEPKQQPLESARHDTETNRATLRCNK